MSFGSLRQPVTRLAGSDGSTVRTKASHPFDRPLGPLKLILWAAPSSCAPIRWSGRISLPAQETVKVADAVCEEAQ